MVEVNDVGFLKAFHWFIPGVQDVPDVFAVAAADFSQKPQLLAYLEQCPELVGFMDRLFDEEGNEIGSFAIHTDGEWVWPSYAGHYLTRPGYRLQDERFLRRVAERGFAVPTLSSEAARALLQRYLEFSKTGRW
ncbi:hypothetical protein [Hymenobacter arizonensis]|uniref:Uncharacterized protein n=1 Tax=Hymenobacter arizonensis TaxID=1227077 RepID=A0A1I6BL22_HYMAR|nr:hypothetical protein [Hymenobacter arizonensis]SFQ81620.1 hypothetical protein SAMN04515668_4702 [Hymenobacter arizonensis]